MQHRTLTHLALAVADLDASTDFYHRFAGMEIVHERTEPTGSRVAWIHDGELPFIVVLIAIARPRGINQLIRKASQAIARHAFAPVHLGVSCTSREQVDELCELARKEGRLRRPGFYAGGDVGYYAILSDPDGHNVELSFGQDVGLHVERAVRYRKEREGSA